MLLHESLTQSRLMTVSTTGVWNIIPGTGSTGFAIIDTGALFGQGGDNPGTAASYQFTPNASATAGVAFQPGTGTANTSQPTVTSAPAGAGGIYLVAHTATGQTASTAPAAIGAGLTQAPGFGEVFVWQGGIQPHTTGTQGAAYFLDLIQAGGGAFGTVASPAAQQQICSLLLPQGDGWIADWSAEILGTASTADINNFSLVLGLQTVATAVNSGAIGVYAQTPFTLNSTLPTGEYLSVTAGATQPTSATTYGAVLYGPGLPVTGNQYVWQPSVFLADASATSEQLPATPADTAGFTPRHTWVWASVSYQGQLNALNGNAYTPNGNLAGWSAFANCSISAVTPPPGSPLPPVQSGVLVTPAGTGTVGGASAPSFAATAGTIVQVYTQAWVNAATNTYDAFTGVDWYDASGNKLSRTGLGGPVPQASWTPVSSWNTAPTGTVTGVPFGEFAPVSPGTIPATVTTCFAGVVAVSPLPPSPLASWSGGLTSAALNGTGGPYQALAFLNNPPVMRVAQGLTTSVPNNAPTPMTFSTNPWVVPGIDNYNAFLALTGAYNVPVNGFYLAFATFPFTANSTGSRYAGFQVTSGTAVSTFGGPGYAAVSASSVPTSASAFRVLDLKGGDQVVPVAYQNSGGSLALTNGAPGYASRFGMMYLCPWSTGGVNSATAPATAFHWAAGIPPSLLPGFLDEHLGNDLSFLVNRPYFTGYQKTAQTGLSNGSWNTVTIDTPGGLVHSMLGDNYAGWNASANAYVAQVPGWYLVLAEVYAALPTAATGFIYAGIKVPTSGGIAPSTTPDQYQTMFYPKTTGPVPGAAAIGMYYLAQGESVSPMIRCAGWGGSYSTSVSSSPSIHSQFSVIWLAE